MRYKSKKEAQHAHIENYRSDGVMKQYGNPNQSHFLRIVYIVDQIPPKSRVLDVGCNGGPIGVFLLRKQCHVNGIDIVQELVDKAKRRGIYAIKGEAEKLSAYRDNMFDVVICGEVLEHLYDPFPAVQEAFRVLKPGGRYIITVPHPNSFLADDKLGDYHQQNFTLEILNTLIYSFFPKDYATVVEIPYIERYNLANGIKPIGKNPDGSNAYPPQWIGITAIKPGGCHKCGDPSASETEEWEKPLCQLHYEEKKNKDDEEKAAKKKEAAAKKRAAQAKAKRSIARASAKRKKAAS